MKLPRNLKTNMTKCRMQSVEIRKDQSPLLYTLVRSFTLDPKWDPLMFFKAGE